MGWAPSGWVAGLRQSASRACATSRTKHKSVQGGAQRVSAALGYIEDSITASSVYASRAVQVHPHGGQSDFVRPPARTVRVRCTPM